MSGLDHTVPNVARMYDYYLGGKDNFEADRQAAAQVLQAAPQTPALARANRGFLQRAVTHLAREVGIGQFLDIGAGLPTQGNVHEIVQGSRVVYVDNDAVVLAHARALLATTASTNAVSGDLREPEKILADPDVLELIDLGRPVAVLLVSVLHCLTEDEDPYAKIAFLRDALPSGSHLVLSHISAQERVEAAQRGAEVYKRASTTMTLRDREQIMRMFDGFDLLEPGLVELQDWRPETEVLDEARPPRLVPVRSGAQAMSEHPVITFNPISGQQPVGTAFAALDALREEFPAFGSDVGPGFWVLTRYDAILSAIQDPELFSNSAVSVFDANPRYRWIPEMLDPPEHTVWRRLLSPLFAPDRVAAMSVRLREHCAALVAEIAAKGECDFVHDFARKYPTVIFLELMGLPVEQLDTFLEWEDAVLHQPPSPDRTQARIAAMGQVTACFRELIAARRAEPRDDLVSTALTWEIDGEPASEPDLLALCLLLFLAGLDTVTAQLSYAFWHLARHPADRTRLAGDASLIPAAVEEFVRAHAIVLPGRKLTRDATVQGCPMKAGDMVMLPLSMASRDPRTFPEADAVVLDRDKNRHLGFGAGPHRCVGAHLARTEIRIAIEEWHRLIPDYRIPETGQAIEHAYQLLGLDHLPLTWE